MAYQFAYGKMASSVIPTDLASVVIEGNVANVVSPIAAYEGSFVTLGNPIADGTYSYVDANGATQNATVEYDAYTATAPAAATDEIAVLDPEVIESLSDDAGNIYRYGVKLYNKKLPAGWFGRARRLALHDKFWLGDSNFVSAPTVGQFGTATLGDFRLTAATAAGANFAVKILASKDLTAGMGKVGTSYLCEVVGI